MKKKHYEFLFENELIRWRRSGRWCRRGWRSIRLLGRGGGGPRWCRRGGRGGSRRACGGRGRCWWWWSGAASPSSSSSLSLERSSRCRCFSAPSWLVDFLCSLLGAELICNRVQKLCLHEGVVVWGVKTVKMHALWGMYKWQNREPFLFSIFYFYFKLDKGLNSCFILAANGFFENKNVMIYIVLQKWYVSYTCEQIFVCTTYV